MVPLQTAERLRTLLALCATSSMTSSSTARRPSGCSTLGALVAAGRGADPAALRILRARRARRARRHDAPNARVARRGPRLEGVLLTMFDERTNLGQQVANEVREFFKGKKSFGRSFPATNPSASEAPSLGTAGHCLRRQIAGRRSAFPGPRARGMLNARRRQRPERRESFAANAVPR